jgi:hypothetical protein
MEIIHPNQISQSLSLNTVRGGKRTSDALLTAERELLDQMSEALTIVYGGHFKKRRLIA